MSGYNELEAHGIGLQLKIELLWRLLLWSGLLLHKTKKWATDPKWAQKWGVLFCAPVFNFLGPCELPLGGLKLGNNYSH
jgi:hypothetical protein